MKRTEVLEHNHRESVKDRASHLINTLQPGSVLSVAGLKYPQMCRHLSQLLLDEATLAEEVDRGREAILATDKQLSQGEN